MRNLVFIVIIIFLLSACSSTKFVEVPVEVIKKEYIHDTRIDSVYIKDSIDRWQKGDTLYITKWHTKYKYIINTDTVLKTDTITKVVTIVEEKKVEINKLKWYQSTLMWIGGIVSLIIIFILGRKIKTII